MRLKNGSKREKKARKKRLTKQMKSLLERAKEHRIKTEKGEKDTTPDYWISEAERLYEYLKKDLGRVKRMMKGY